MAVERVSQYSLYGIIDFDFFILIVSESPPFLKGGFFLFVIFIIHPLGRNYRSPFHAPSGFDAEVGVLTHL